jgi:hypothetical protein
MSDARITDVAAITDFRAALAEFALAASQALTDIQLELRRGLDWIANDRGVHWQSEVRRSADLVARAKDELVHSRTYKKVGDYTPSCIEEKKAVEMAKRRLEHAEQKVQAVRHWTLAARRAVDEFQGPVQQLMGMIDGDVPRAIALLERMSAALEQYSTVAAPDAATWEQLAGESTQSMAQPAEEPGDADQSNPQSHETSKREAQPGVAAQGVVK